MCVLVSTYFYADTNQDIHEQIKSFSYFSLMQAYPRTRQRGRDSSASWRLSIGPGFFPLTLLHLTNLLVILTLVPSGCSVTIQVLRRDITHGRSLQMHPIQLGVVKRRSEHEELGVTSRRGEQYFACQARQKRIFDLLFNSEPKLWAAAVHCSLLH